VVLALAANFCVGFVQSGFYGGMGLRGLLLFVLNAILMLVFVYGVLAFFRLERRFRQTVAALIGVDTVVTLCFLPIPALGTLAGADLTSEPFGVIQVGFVFWLIYISATILARSLSQSLLVGLGFEILYICLSLFIAVMLSPDISALDTTSV